MSDLKLTGTGNPALNYDNDLLIESGDLVFMEDPQDAVEQSLRTTLRSFFGEWFLDESKGLPYTQSIFVKGVNAQAIEALYVEAIINDPGVVRLDRLNLSIDTASRTGTLGFKAITLNGTIVFQEAL